MNKRCLKSPGSPASKQKMRRVLALAAAGKASAASPPPSVAAQPKKATATQEPARSSKPPKATPQKRQGMPGLQSTNDYEQTIQASATDRVTGYRVIKRDGKNVHIFDLDES